MSKARPRPEPTTDPHKLDIRDLSLRLLLYVQRRITAKGWRDEDPILSEGQGAQDLTVEAVSSLFGGPRKWDPTREPDPWRHLMSVANSLLSNALKADDVRKTSRGVETELIPALDDPEQTLIAKERLAWGRRAKELLEERILEDDDLMAMHHLAETDDIVEPAAVAAKLGWKRERVYNANARLRRHREEVVRQLRAQLLGGHS